MLHLADRQHVKAFQRDQHQNAPQCHERSLLNTRCRKYRIILASHVRGENFMKRNSSLSQENQDERLQLEGMDQRRRGGRQMFSSTLDRHGRCSQDNGSKADQGHRAVKQKCPLLNSPPLPLKPHGNRQGCLTHSGLLLKWYLNNCFSGSVPAQGLQHLLLRNP